VEDLAVNGMARTRMAKSVHDAGWSAFVAMLEYKARLYGRAFHRIGRFEPAPRAASCSARTSSIRSGTLRAWSPFTTISPTPDLNRGTDGGNALARSAGARP